MISSVHSRLLAKLNTLRSRRIGLEPLTRRSPYRRNFTLLAFIRLPFSATFSVNNFMSRRSWGKRSAIQFLESLADAFDDAPAVQQTTRSSSFLARDLPRLDPGHQNPLDAPLNPATDRISSASELGGPREDGELSARLAAMRAEESRLEDLVRSVLPPAPLNPGHPHKDYLRDKKKHEVIFSVFLPNWRPQWYESMIKPRFCVPKSTFYGWKHQWQEDKNWRPWNTEVHGLSLRAFDPLEEALIANTITTEYIEAGRLFTEQTFHKVAAEAWEGFGKEGEFACSKQFIFNFKQRNGFSSRRFHTRRRNPTESKEQIEAWITAIRDLLIAHEGKRDMVVNCDETAWRLLPSGLLTWAPVGADGVTVRLNGNEKDSITVLASVTAGGDKLPLFAIAKGKTKRAEQSQLGSDGTTITDHSASGWSTVETFEHYLDSLAEQYRGRIDPEHPLHLILDCYAVHRAVQIKAHAKKLGIKLWFIPAGYTDELQPLDRAVFGVLKAIFRRRFEELCRQSPNGRVTRSIALEILKGIWKDLSLASIHEGWAIYEDDFGPDADEADADWEE
jgi:hypothetical protein